MKLSILLACQVIRLSNTHSPTGKNWEADVLGIYIWNKEGHVTEDVLKLSFFLAI